MNQTTVGFTTWNVSFAETAGAIPVVPFGVPENGPPPAAPRHLACLPTGTQWPAKSSLAVRAAGAATGSGRALA
ncbi:hypothetical protein ADK41_00930 [Streptomyces caelestis]|uniref:Uncharacterized protein n=1 Tax=Streptomyces caelestis TaxID=36816 RepID=A0A0M8QV76_9ACTN|nr:MULTISPECIES: hypothetical protein [Streptomyces]KOT46782.1 hypothetical protein ADK41_00930 [Streptomyces caelestis]